VDADAGEGVLYWWGEPLPLPFCCVGEGDLFDSAYANSLLCEIGSP